VTEKLRQDVLALFDRRAPQVLAVEFEEVERAEHGGGIMTVPADQVENGKSAFVADDGLAVDQAGTHWQHCQGGAICGSRFEKLLPSALLVASAAHHFW
jgi:hypothetical protein